MTHLLAGGETSTFILHILEMGKYTERCNSQKHCRAGMFPSAQTNEASFSHLKRCINITYETLTCLKRCLPVFRVAPFGVAWR